MNQLLVGDCRDLLLIYPDNYFDSCIVDTPYELGFMGKAWDKTGIAYDVPTWQLVLRKMKPGAHLLAFGSSRTYHRIACAIEDAGFEIRDQIMWVYGSGFPKNANSQLKPAHEPIILARKPFAGSAVACVAQHGTGHLRIDACRIPAPEGLTSGGQSGRPAQFMDAEAGKLKTFHSEAHVAGRWPANLIHDGSDEVVALFPQAKGQQGNVQGNEPSEMTGSNCYGGGFKRQPAAARNDTGSAARFFYCAKVSTTERGPGNDHPCVKPQALLRYLARLVTPPGGRILDHFTGSGSGPLAFTAEGFAWSAMDLSPHHIAIAARRLAAQRQAMGLFAP